MGLVDLIAQNCRGNIDKHGGFTVQEAALNQLLGDGRVVGVQFSGSLMALDVLKVSRADEKSGGEEVVFPFGQPQEAYRIALPPQSTDPVAYLKPAASEQKQQIAQFYKTKGGIMHREGEIARLTRYAAYVNLAPLK